MLQAGIRRRTLVLSACLFALAVLVLVVASANAQTLLYTLDTPNPQAHAYFSGFLSAVAVGEVNGDGKGDIAVGAYYEDVGGNTDQGRAYVFSGDVGTLTVEKVLVPSSDSGKFDLKIDGTIEKSDAGHGDSTGPVVVSVGSHVVSEAAGSGTDLANYDSVIGGHCAPDGSISLAPGENKTCTITNTKLGTIIVEKQTDPDGAAGTFTFAGDASGTISDGQQIVVSGLLPGTYTSTEMVPAGWDLTSIVCDDTNSSGAVATATFELHPGETVKCTFTNTLDVTPTPTPRFLTLPFVEWPYHITDGWGRYTGGCVPPGYSGKEHWGIDYGTQKWPDKPECWELPVGTPILAAAAGEAMASSQYYPSGGGYGEFVLVWHGNGYSSLYAHLEDFAPTLKSQECPDKHDCDNWVPVEQGQLIGYSGETGTDYPHLHFEVAKVDEAAEDRYSEHVLNKLDPYDINRHETLGTPDFKSSDEYPDADTVAACGDAYLWRSCPPTVAISVLLVSLTEWVERWVQKLLSLVVPTRLAELAVAVSWDGSDIDVSLISPSQRTIACPTVDPDVVCDQGPTSTIITVDTPEAGEWTIGLFGADVPEGGEQVSVVATGEPLPIAIGGIVEMQVNTSGSSVDSAADSPRGSFSPPYEPIAGAAAALLVLSTGAWYARRRWLG